MKNSFISIEKTRRGKPAAAFFLSLLWTGAGEFRYGKKSAGTVLMILRVLPFLLLPVLMAADQDMSPMALLLVSVAGALAITLYSPIRSALLFKGKNEISEEKITSPIILILYILFNTLLTLGALGVIFSFFSLHRVTGNENLPSLAKGDLLLIASLSSGQIPAKGNMVLVKTDDGYGAYRIITERPVNVDIKKGQYTLQGSELSVEPPDEDTTAAYRDAPEADMLIETNGTRRYPVLVITGTEKEKKEKDGAAPEKNQIKLTTGEVLLSRDDRRGEKFFIVKKKGELRLKVIGVLFHARGFSLPSVPWL